MTQTRPLWLIAAPVVFLILWSAGFAVAKIAVAHAAPLTVLALRYALVLVLLIPVALVMRPRFPSARGIWDVAVVGFLIQVVYFGLCYVAFKSGVSAGGVAIVVCLQPILVALIAPRLVGERIGARGWVGLALGLAGAATVVLARSKVEAENVFGLVCTVLALLGITAGTLYEKRFGANHHPVASNLIQYAVGTAFCLPAALLTESLAIDWVPEFIWAMAYLVLANSLLAMSLLLAMIRAGEVSRVSSLFYLVPALSALFAWPMLGEAMPPLGWAGMALAAVGVALVSRKRPRRQPQPLRKPPKRRKRSVRPVGRAGGIQRGLAGMDQPVGQHLQVVRPQRLAGRGDVGNRLGGSVLHRALGCPLAVDQRVIRHAIRRQEFTHQAVILGGNPQPVAMRRPEPCRRGVQIVQRVHVDPARRHRNHQIGMAKAHRRPFGHLRRPVGQLVAHQVRSRHPKVNPPRRQLARDLARAQQHQFHAADAIDRTGILALVAGARHGHAARAEPVEGLFHQPPLGRHTQLQHHAPRSRATRPGRMMPPTAGIDRPAPRTAVSAS